METSTKNQIEKLRIDLAKQAESYFNDCHFTASRTLSLVLLDGEYEGTEAKDIASTIHFIEELRARANEIDKIEKGEWNE